MKDNKIIKFFIYNIAFVVIGSKLAEYIIKAPERKIERFFMIYFFISLIFFLYYLKKEDKNARV